MRLLLKDWGEMNKPFLGMTELEQFVSNAIFDYEQEHDDWIENKEGQVKYLVQQLLNQYEVTKKQLEFKI